MSLLNELFVVYMETEESIFNKIKKYSCKKNTKESLSSLRKSLRENFKYNYPNNKYREVIHSFSNGSKTYILIIEKGMNRFEINEALLDVFKEAYEEDKLSYNIQCLDNKDQITCIKSLTILEKTLRFTIPMYGKKAKQVKKNTKLESGFYTTISAEKTTSLIKESLILGEKNNLARELCYLPPNRLDAKNYILKVMMLLTKYKNVSVDFYNISDLKKIKANLFLAVAQADLKQGGGIIKLHYKPKGKKKTPKKICLIGKGVVYDSGGLDLKTDGSLEGMHRDMTGSAVALASFLSQVELKSEHELTCFLPIVENKISRDGYRAMDIIETMDGTAVEIVNTDAEGRLILADSILLAKKKKQDLIIDYSTLTGTAIDALGGRMAAGFANNDNLRKVFELAGEKSGERVWGFPVFSDIKSRMTNCEQGDIYQVLPGEDCDHIIGAAFLQYFTGKTPHIHLDIGCEHVEEGLGLIDTSVTGFGVFFTHYLLKEFKKM